MNVITKLFFTILTIVIFFSVGGATGMFKNNPIFVVISTIVIILIIIGIWKQESK